MNFNKYKFRASGVGNLMVKSRSKSSPLSETSKTYLQELWIKEVFNREKYDTRNKYTNKGTACESDSLDLLEKVDKQTYFKNQKQIENDWIKGTPDIIKPDYIIDIKTSWDIWTFAKVDEDSAKKAYYYQLLSYMWLTNTTKANLVYCLVDTPEDIITDELYKLSFQFPEINDSEEITNKFRRNYLFKDIDPVLRVKNYPLEYLEDDIKEMQSQIKLAREYMNTLSL